ncbi:MAG: twin-arginine translocase TatA/TatE family subunit [Chloroflexi bacterium]|nr:twin-arginine translocase TatA/TatE family subunit [Chloroflexota bacterium]
MDFFGIGVLEVVAVLLLIAIVFGPHRLPEIAGQFGRAIRDLREYARDFRDEYLTDFEEVREEYLEVRHDLEQTDQELREEFQQIDADMRMAAAEVKGVVEETTADVKGSSTSPDEEVAETPAGAAANAAAAAEAAAEAASEAAAVAAAVEATLPDPAPIAQRPRGARRRLGRTSSGASKAARPGNVISINRRRRPGG